MGTKELSAKTGIPTTTLNLWVSQGILRPAVTGYGTGSRHEFSEDNVAQALAIKLVREEFGDGRYAKVALESIPLVRAGAQYFDVPRFELALT